MDNKETEKFILGWINWMLNQDIKEFVKTGSYRKIKNSLTKKINNYTNSNEFRKNVHELAQDALKQNEKQGKTFKQVLPKGFENSLKVLVYNKSPEITLAIKNYVNDIKFRNMIKNEVNKFLVGLNPMVAKFINGDSIHVKIMNSLNSYIDSTENIMNIVNQINNKIDELSYKPLTEILNYIPYESKNSIINATVDSVLNLFNNKEFSKKVESQIDNYVLSYGTLGNLVKGLGFKEQELLCIIENSMEKYVKLKNAK